MWTMQLCNELNLLLTDLPELESYKSRINQLEEENKSLQTSLQYAHAEIEDLKAKADVTESQQQKINDNQGRINSELKELQRRHIKLECHSRRGNLKFLGVKEGERESNRDTEMILHDFMCTKLKIPPEDLKEIYFDRVHRISTHTRDGRNSGPRPIIVKLSAYQDKNFIKSFIKNIPKGTNIGISDDFPKEVDEMRKKLYPVLKAAKREKKEAYIKVEQLLINGSVTLSRTGNSSLPSVWMFNEQLVLEYVLSTLLFRRTTQPLLNCYRQYPSIFPQSVNTAQRHR